MRQLSIHLVNKVWGRLTPPAPFSNHGDQPLGEIWFAPPPEISNLLVKFIFTNAALSVQVHPDDARAPRGKRGKHECWYVLEAEPGAKLAVGLTREMTVDQLRQAALDGSIEQDLAFVEVTSGDFFSIPAGTIHAIGAGISLLEVQQNSDVTYRLYDYGRPRELHLEDALLVADRKPVDSRLHRRPPQTGYVELIDGPFFRVAKLADDGVVPKGRFDGSVMILPLQRGVLLQGEPVEVGSNVLSQGISALKVERGGSVILVEETTRA